MCIGLLIFSVYIFSRCLISLKYYFYIVHSTNLLSLKLISTLDFCFQFDFLCWLFSNKYLSYLVFMSHLFFVYHTTVLALLILGLKWNIFGFRLNSNKNLVGSVVKKFILFLIFFYHVLYRLLLPFSYNIMCCVFYWSTT